MGLLDRFKRQPQIDDNSFEAHLKQGYRAERCQKCHYLTVRADSNLCDTCGTYNEIFEKKQMKAFDYTKVKSEKEQGWKNGCSVCKQRFDTYEEYLRHHVESCSGRGA